MEDDGSKERDILSALTQDNIANPLVELIRRPLAREEVMTDNELTTYKIIEEK